MAPLGYQESSIVLRSAQGLRIYQRKHVFRRTGGSSTINSALVSTLQCTSIPASSKTVTDKHMRSLRLVKSSSTQLILAWHQFAHAWRIPGQSGTQDRTSWMCLSRVAFGAFPSTALWVDVLTRCHTCVPTLSWYDIQAVRLGYGVGARFPTKLPVCSTPVRVQVWPH